MSRLNREFLEVGDEVIILDLHKFDREQSPQITTDMYDEIGKKYTIKEISKFGKDEDDWRIFLNGSFYRWLPKWIKKV